MLIYDRSGHFAAQFMKRDRTPSAVIDLPSAGASACDAGGADVTVRPLPGFDHVNSWIQAMPRADNWFHSLD
jgi:hypothetical protein